MPEAGQRNVCDLSALASLASNKLTSMSHLPAMILCKKLATRLGVHIKDRSWFLTSCEVVGCYCGQSHRVWTQSATESGLDQLIRGQA